MRQSLMLYVYNLKHPSSGAQKRNVGCLARRKCLYYCDIRGQCISEGLYLYIYTQKQSGQLD